MLAKMTDSNTRASPAKVAVCPVALDKPRDTNSMQTPTIAIAPPIHQRAFGHCPVIAKLNNPVKIGAEARITDACVTDVFNTPTLSIKG